MVFYTADMHLDDMRAFKLSKRPFKNLDEMRSSIIYNWNSVVSNEDDVYIIGDVCLKLDMFISVIKKLNGIIHIIPGNHDENLINRAKIEYISDKIIYYSRDIVTVIDGGYVVVLCHYPFYEWPGFFNSALHFHGHTHGNLGVSFKDDAYDVGVDVRRFKPVKLSEVLNWHE